MHGKVTLARANAARAANSCTATSISPSTTNLVMARLELDLFAAEYAVA